VKTTYLIASDLKEGGTAVWLFSLPREKKELCGRFSTFKGNRESDRRKRKGQRKRYYYDRKGDDVPLKERGK